MKNRTESLQVLRHRLFDLLVIGGGIAGAAVAQNAASRGLSVALIEQEDFASGSSGRSSKLVHDGLAYVEDFQLDAATQLGRERDLLQRIAPHLVRDCRFILPLGKNDRMANWKKRLGFAFYDLIAITSKSNGRSENLDAEAVLQLAPALSPHHLSGALRFHDCITNDCRMVMALLKSACSYGAVAVNYLQAKSFLLEAGRVQGAACRNRYTGEDFIVRAKTYVNACGISVDEVALLADPSYSKRISTSKSVHVIVPLSAFETNIALLLPDEDKRHVFVVPWKHALLIGATNSPFDKNGESELPNRDEVDYLLNVVNRYTGKQSLSRSHVVASYASVRPVVRAPLDGAADTTSAGSARSQSVVWETRSGMVNVAGGHITGYRVMANNVVDRVCMQLSDVTAREAKTSTAMLGGWSSTQEFVTRSSEISAHARKLDMEPAVIEHLIASYGAEAAAIIGLVEFDKTMGDRICANYPVILAEIIFVVQTEMAVSLEDVLFRRLPIGVLNHQEALAAAPLVASLMQRLLDWDEVRVQAELTGVERKVQSHMELLQDPSPL